MPRLNLKRFFWFVGIVAVLSAATFGVHSLQAGRIAQALLNQADRAEKSDQPDQLSRYLSRYLEMRPNDVEARARFAQALSDERTLTRGTPAQRFKAYTEIERVLIKLPERHDLRLRSAKLALDLGRYSEARTNVQILLKYMPEHGPAEDVAAQVEEAEKHWDEAARFLHLTIAHAPETIGAYVRLAALCRQHPWPRKPSDSLSDEPDRAAELAAEADRVLNLMVENNPKSARAYLARWNTRSLDELNKDKALLAKAGPDVERTLQLAPDEADTLLAASDYALLHEEPDAARGYLRQGRESYPQDVRMHRKSAGLEIQLKNFDAAVAVLRDAAHKLEGDAKVDMLWTLCNVFVDAGKSDDATAVVEELRKASASELAIQYLQGRIAASLGNWSAAVKYLETARAALTAEGVRSEVLLTQTDALLARCYEQLNVPDLHLAALDRELRRNPDSIPTLMTKAAVLAAAGRTADALTQYERVVQLADAPPAAWIEQARLTLQLCLVTGKPGWPTVAAVLKETVAKAPEGSALPLLQVEAAVALSRLDADPAGKTKHLDEARGLLEKMNREHPEWAEPWAARAALADFVQDPNQAAAVWSEAEKKGGNTPALRIARIRYWARHADRAAAGEALDRLALVPAGAPPADDAFFSELAEANYRQNRFKEAGAIWARLVAAPEHKNDLRLRMLLFQAAYQMKDNDGMVRAVKELESIEGADGTITNYCAAVRLIVRGREGNLDCLDEAAVLLGQVGRQRPTWSAVPLALAEIAEILADKKNSPQAAAEAAEHYRTAIRLGDRNPSVVRRLVQQLYKLQRNDDAFQEIQKLQNESQSPELQRLNVALLLARQEPLQALNEAGKIVAAESKDYRDQLWLGQVYLASGQQDRLAEAGEHLQKALDLDDSKPECWQALVQYLASTGKMEQARAAAERAERRLSAADAALTLAQCWEAVGNFDKAGEFYEKALQTPDPNGQAQQAAATFFVRLHRMDRAEEVFKGLMGKASTNPASASWARRTLALTLAGGEDYRRFPEALRLVGLHVDGAGQVVEDAVPTGEDPSEEQRARARVLSRQPRRGLRQYAIDLLEGLGARKTDEDQFLLARLYELSGPGGWPRARDILSSLVAHGASPGVVAYFAQGELRQHDFAGAETHIGRLETLEKDRQTPAGGFGSIELRAQLLELRGDVDAANKFLRSYLEQANAVRPRHERVLLLAQFLGRQRQFPEALDLCRGARDKMPPPVITGATLALLRNSEAKPEDCREFEDWLGKELAKDPRARFLMLGLADLYNLTGRYPEAEAQYAQVLQAHENSVEALNNLAWLYAVRADKAAEGLKLIQRAIEVWGPRPELLDTRATVYRKLGKSEEAIRDLETANADQPSATWLFNLSQAHWSAKNPKAAAEVFKRAREAGLKPEQLHALERPAYAQLAKEFDQR